MTVVLVILLVGPFVPAIGHSLPLGAPREDAPASVQAQGTASSEGSEIQQANDRDVARIMTQIGQRKSESAGTVFKNVRLAWLRAAPAEDFLTIMNVGYAKALGVRCTHCHVPDDFASDTKRPKQAAREMAVMHRMINRELGKMRHLRGTADERAINCAACHRGTLDPTQAQ